MMRNLPQLRERGAAQLRHLRCAPRGRLRPVHFPAEDARVLPVGERAAVRARAAQGRAGRLAESARAGVGRHRGRRLRAAAARARGARPVRRRSGQPRAAAAGLRLRRRLRALAEAGVLPRPAAARRGARRLHDPGFVLRVRARAGRAARRCCRAAPSSCAWSRCAASCGKRSRNTSGASRARPWRAPWRATISSPTPERALQRMADNEMETMILHEARRGDGGRAARRGVGRNGAAAVAHPRRAGRARGARPARRLPVDAAGSARARQPAGAAFLFRHLRCPAPRVVPAGAGGLRAFPAQRRARTALWQVVREGRERWLECARGLLALNPAAREAALESLLPPSAR